MSIETTYILRAVLVGIGATMVMDLWALFLRHVLGISSLNYCLVGRWLRHMPDGKFMHKSIAASPQRSFECTVGWISHYMIGAAFALVFVVLVSSNWLDRPSLMPSLVFGIGTVLVPFLIMQPSFGLGVAASKMPNPTQARLRSLITHAIFGVGLYASAVFIKQISSAHA